MIIVYNIISSIFDLFILYIYFNEIFINKRKQIHKAFFFLCFILVEIILMANTYINPPSISTTNKIIAVFLSVGTTFALCHLYNASLWHRILAAITFQFFAALGETLTTLQLYLTFPDVLDSNTIYLNCFMETISKLFIFVIVIVFINFWKRNFQSYNIKYNILVLSTPTISIFICFFVPTNIIPTHNEISFIYILIICLTALNIINYYLLKDILKVSELQNKTAQLELSIAYQREKYQQLNTSYRNTRRIVHDMKKHYNTIEALTRVDKKEALYEYLNTSVKEIENTYTKYNTGNLVIDTMLYNYDNLANSYRIPFNVSLNVDSNKVPVSEYDLCIIIGNLLDNSIDACLNLPTQDAWINVSICTTEKHILIETENKIPKSRSNSNQKHLHGFGVENIRISCKKYMALYDIFTENDIYTASIAIPIFKPDGPLKKYRNYIDVYGT